ncbi:MAG: hypothetical protein KatS3mg110_1073 [Pirellulaceae bacterium]|nr:MAG: hypothetical protein KatS3mg110_1073 [Pirellulaceae bacterium]
MAVGRRRVGMGVLALLAIGFALAQPSVQAHQTGDLTPGWVVQEDSPNPSRDDSEEPRSWRRLWWGFQENNNGRAHRSVREAFQSAIRQAAASTVKIYCGRVQVAQGTVIDSHGWILTKASELKSNPECRFADGRTLPAELVTENSELDLALLRVPASDLVPIAWRTGDPPAAGSWLVSPDTGQLPLAIGVVSNEPRAIPMPRAVLGIMLANAENGVRITSVMEGSPAEEAGLKADDVVVELDGKAVSSQEELVNAIRARRPGDQVTLAFLREGEKRTVTARLVEIDRLGPSRERFQNALGGPLSQRRWGFAEVLEHDSVLRPSDCGGPVVDIDGKAVGINIARAGRVVTYALPYRVLAPFLEEVKSGKFGPAGELNEKQLAVRVHQLRQTIQELTRQVDRLAKQIEEKKHASSQQDSSNADNELSQLEKAMAEAKSRLERTLAELRRYENPEEVSQEMPASGDPPANR